MLSWFTYTSLYDLYQCWSAYCSWIYLYLCWHVCICVYTYICTCVSHSMSCGCDSLAGVMLFAIANLLCYCFLFKYKHISSSFHVMGTHNGVCHTAVFFHSQVFASWIFYPLSLWLYAYVQSLCSPSSLFYIIETVFTYLRTYVVCTGLYSHLVEMRPSLLHQYLVL